jgi:DNA-directed RNA polymerase III subunit RPC6
MQFEYSVSSVAELLRRIEESGVVRDHKLERSDLAKLLDALVYDGRASKVVVEGQPDRYYARTAQPLAGGLMATPCGVCPVASQCSENGVISPRTCPYLNDW